MRDAQLYKGGAYDALRAMGYGPDDALTFSTELAAALDAAPEEPLSDFPTRLELAGALMNLRDDVLEACPECWGEDGPCHDDCVGQVPVRLQVHNGWAVRWGSADYDQDHRGLWGSSYLWTGDTGESLMGVADVLLEQARDMEEEHADVI